jgi:hypothetical protein
MIIHYLIYLIETRSPYRAARILLDSRSQVLDQADLDGPKAAQLQLWLRLLAFIGGLLPQTIKIFTSTGIPWTLTAACFYLIPFIVYEILALLGNEKFHYHTALTRNQDHRRAALGRVDKTLATCGIFAHLIFLMWATRDLVYGIFPGLNDELFLILSPGAFIYRLAILLLAMIPTFGGLPLLFYCLTPAPNSLYARLLHFIFKKMSAVVSAAKGLPVTFPPVTIPPVIRFLCKTVFQVLVFPIFMGGTLAYVTLMICCIQIIVDFLSPFYPIPVPYIHALLVLAILYRILVIPIEFLSRFAFWKEQVLALGKLENTMENEWVQRQAVGAFVLAFVTMTMTIPWYLVQYNGSGTSKPRWTDLLG